MTSASHIRGYLYLPEKVEIVALCDVGQDSAERRLNNVVEEAKNRADQTNSPRLQKLWQACNRDGFRFTLIISGFWTYLVWM